MSLDAAKPFIALRIAVLTVSDTRTIADDRSGDTLAERLTGADCTAPSFSTTTGTCRKRSDRPTSTACAPKGHTAPTANRNAPSGGPGWTIAGPG